MRHAFAALFLFLLSSAAFAQVAVPHTFTAGAAARASEVNANFTTLATAINDLAARVTALETPTVTAASAAGTYRYLSLSVGVLAQAGPSSSGLLQVTGETITGTVVLSAGGSASYSTSPASTNSRITVPSGGGAPTTAHTRDSAPENSSATWTVSSGQIVITNQGISTTFVPASPRLLIGTLRELSDSDFYSLEILIKQ